MPKQNLRKVQTYLSAEEAIDADISDFLQKSTKGRQSSNVRELLYVAWAAMGEMSPREFETRFPSFQYADFKKKYRTTGNRAAETAAPQVSEPTGQRVDTEKSKPAFKIKPPTAE